ncbi:MAG: hypothetical protein J3Q66DRAFT_178295 [Benniella sp.]|nr:MAG: hypothetical protein J3Q66DRAFT_178295 [Benniella sp.]
MATHRPTQPSLAQAHVPGHHPHQTLNHVQNRTLVRPVAAYPPLPQLRKPYPPPQEPDSPHPLTEPPSPFFMKPLTRAPDYRFNLYVKGLAPTTTTRGLFELFKPYGNILACKTILDTETGHCRGGFVLFDNQESCSEARRALTQQGLYVAVAHESACIKNLPPPESPPPEIKAEVPEVSQLCQLCHTSSPFPPSFPIATSLYHFSARFTLTHTLSITHTLSLFDTTVGR